MYLVIARIVATQGSKGEVRAEIVTDYPERFASTSFVCIGPGHQRYELEKHRVADGKVVVLKLRGIDTIGQAEALRGALVEVPEEEAVELPPGHFFWHQVLGLEVFTVAGELLGKVEDILETGANDVYVVRGASREILIPAIKQVVKSVEPEAGRMIVELLPGLME